jgi:NADH-quinone oxidoreductase subunit L
VQEEPVHALDDGSGHGGHPHPHESPAVMLIPLIVLAVPAIIAGFANLDHDFERVVAGALPADLELEETKFRLGIAIASTLVPLAGVALAYVIYGARLVSAESLARTFKAPYNLLANKYYLDTLYERVIVDRLFYRGVGGALSEFDRLAVDGAVNGAGVGARQSSNILRHLQSGEFQTYAALAFSGLVITALLVLVLSPL